MTERRHKAFLRNTGGYNERGRKMVKLPQKVWKEMGWKIGENLQIDIIKTGTHHSVSIARDDDE
tara:strand:- start:344 stop:535 length:192 start_codon:yes stop_codon:yes gene_type:complete